MFPKYAQKIVAPFFTFKMLFFKIAQKVAKNLKNAHSGQKSHKTFGPTIVRKCVAQNFKKLPFPVTLKVGKWKQMLKFDFLCPRRNLKSWTGKVHHLLVDKLRQYFAFFKLGHPRLLFMFIVSFFSNNLKE